MPHSKLSFRLRIMEFGLRHYADYRHQDVLVMAADKVEPRYPDAVLSKNDDIHICLNKNLTYCYKLNVINCDV